MEIFVKRSWYLTTSPCWHVDCHSSSLNKNKCILDIDINIGLWNLNKNETITSSECWSFAWTYVWKNYHEIEEKRKCWNLNTSAFWHFDCHFWHYVCRLIYYLSWTRSYMEWILFMDLLVWDQLWKDGRCTTSVSTESGMVPKLRRQHV